MTSESDYKHSPERQYRHEGTEQRHRNKGGGDDDDDDDRPEDVEIIDVIDEDDDEDEFEPKRSKKQRKKDEQEERRKEQRKDEQRKHHHHKRKKKEDRHVEEHKTKKQKDDFTDEEEWKERSDNTARRKRQRRRRETEWESTSSGRRKRRMRHRRKEAKRRRKRKKRKKRDIQTENKKRKDTERKKKEYYDETTTTTTSTKKTDRPCPFPCNFCKHDQECCKWLKCTVESALTCEGTKRNLFCPLIFLAIFAVFVIIGGVMMWVIERHFSFFCKDSAKEHMLEILWRDRNLDKAAWKEEVMRFYYELRLQTPNKKWSLFDAIWYCFSLCTASSAVNLTPNGYGGKIFTIVYAMIGIPLMIIVAEECIRLIIIFLKSIFVTLCGSLWFLVCMVTGRSHRCSRTMSPVNKDNSVSLTFSIIAFFMYTLLGSWLVVTTGPYGFFDAFYSSFLAFATVSMGMVFYDCNYSMTYFVYIIFGIALMDICCEGIGLLLRKKMPHCSLRETGNPVCRAGYTGDSCHHDDDDEEDDDIEMDIDIDDKYYDPGNINDCYCENRY